MRILQIIDKLDIGGAERVFVDIYKKRFLENDKVLVGVPAKIKNK